MKIEKIISHDGNKAIQVTENSVGSFELHLFHKKYDSEEDVTYEVRVTPNPSGLFGNLEEALDEAKRIISSKL